jgi:hypothetical protein
MTTPNLSLPELIANQSQPDVTLNEALRVVDAIAQLTALSRVDTLPGSPGDGDTYILTQATGGGSANDVAFYSGGWQFRTPRTGWLAYVVDEATQYLYGNGSPSGWSVYSSGGGGGASASNGTLDTLAIAGSPSAIVLDLSVAGIFEVTLTQSVNAVSVANLEAGNANFFTLRVTQDGSGGRSLTVPASWQFPSSLGPYVPTQDPGAVDVLQGITYDDGTTWLVNYAKDYG